MKKSTSKISQYRKLILRQEVIVVLTSNQLSNAVGGEASGTACTSVVSGETRC